MNWNVQKILIDRGRRAFEETFWRSNKIMKGVEKYIEWNSRTEMLIKVTKSLERDG